MAQATSYQLVILGPGAAATGPRLEADVRARLREIGDHLEENLRVLDGAEIDSLARTMPAVAVYFGGDLPRDEDAVGKLTRHSVPILPVVDELKGYTSKTPAALHGVNGMEIGAGEPDLSALASLVLENLSAAAPHPSAFPELSPQRLNAHRAPTPGGLRRRRIRHLPGHELGA